MKVRLRINLVTNEARLINMVTGEAIENLLVTNVEVKTEHRDVMEYGRPVHRALLDRRIILTVEVPMSEGQVFTVEMGADHKVVPLSEAIRFIRFPRR